MYTWKNIIYELQCIQKILSNELLCIQKKKKISTSYSGYKKYYLWAIVNKKYYLWAIVYTKNIIYEL